MKYGLEQYMPDAQTENKSAVSTRFVWTDLGMRLDTREEVQTFIDNMLPADKRFFRIGEFEE